MSSFKPVVPQKPDGFTVVLPGTSEEAHKLSEELLLKNNDFHIFFNEKKFHNHLSHHLLAAYSFGASKEKLKEIFEIHAKDQRPLPSSVGTITREKYKEHLGKAEAYSSFLAFFKTEVDTYGMLTTVRRWVLHGDFLSRVMGGIFHPVIHIGYGLEFELPGIVAEGLAMAACTEADHSAIIPDLPELQTSALVPIQAQLYAENANTSLRGMVAQLVDQVSTRLNLNDKQDAPPAANIPSTLHSSPLFELFSKIKQDPVFDGIPTFEDTHRFKTLLSNEKVTQRIKHYAQLWHLKEKSQDLLDSFKDLHLFIALALGSSALRDSHPGTLKLDFYLMHGLTSAEFIHQYIARLTPSESVSLLRAHLSSLILIYIFDNRPTLNIEALLNYESPSLDKKSNNPWLAVFDKSLDCEEAHVIKVVRSCAMGQVIQGSHQDFRLNDVWLKVAAMCIDKDGAWEFAGIGFDETWK